MTTNFHLLIYIFLYRVSVVDQTVRESACNAGDPGLTPGSGRSPGEGNGNPLQYSCLENPMDRRAWWATVHENQRVWHKWVTFTFILHVTLSAAFDHSIFLRKLFPTVRIPHSPGFSGNSLATSYKFIFKYVPSYHVHLLMSLFPSSISRYLLHPRSLLWWSHPGLWL